MLLFFARRTPHPPSSCKCKHNGSACISPITSDAAAAPSDGVSVQGQSNLSYNVLSYCFAEAGGGGERAVADQDSEPVWSPLTSH